MRFSPGLAAKPTPLPALTEEERRAKAEAKARHNPFANPELALTVATVPPAHRIVLNKFPIIPRHFILATREWAPQTELLEPDDLAAAWGCISTWENGEGPGEGSGGVTGAGEGKGGDGEGATQRLFAFFNSGPASGASQPHRHVQFVPVEDMLADSDGGWSPLIDALSPSTSNTSTSTPAPPPPSAVAAALETTPFACYATDLDPHMPPSPAALHAAYLALYRAAVRRAAAAGALLDDDGATDTVATNTDMPTTTTTTTSHSPPLAPDSSATDTNTIDDTPTNTPPALRDALTRTSGPAAISYNLAMTRTRLVLCPRRAEGAPIPLTSPGASVDADKDADTACRDGSDGQHDSPSTGDVKLNGTLLAGTLLVKSVAEWETLRARPALLTPVLQAVGVPRL